MYARLTLYSLAPDMREQAAQLADQYERVLAALDGFREAVFLADDDRGEYGSLSLWDTREQAEAVDAAIAPKLEQELRPISEARPTTQIYAVYRPVAPRG